MILFQLDKILLFKDIINFKYEIQEELKTFSINSAYREGDYRSHRNKTGIKKFKCTGLVKSQHLINYIRSLQEEDDARGNTKCFFIEKYSEFNPNYENIDSDTTTFKTDFKYRIHFNYCYIDIVAINPIKTKNNKVEYNIEFNISLWNPNCYEITYNYNSFIVNRNDDTNKEIWDDVLFYDKTWNYDMYLQNLKNKQQTLPEQRQDMNKYYNDVTCCNDNDYRYILHFDKIVKPFITDNFYFNTGRVDKTVDNLALSMLSDSPLFFAWLSNPLNDNQIVPKRLTLPIYTQKQLNYGFDDSLKGLNLITNSYTENAIIQIWRQQIQKVGDKTKPVSIQSSDVLFEELGQEIRLQVKDTDRVLSDLVITIKTQYLRSKLKMLVIYPHNQKVYGIFDSINFNYSFNGFSFATRNNQLLDLEEYILNGDLTIVNETFNSQAWLSFSPSYRRYIDDTKNNNFITFSIKFKDGRVANIAKDKGLFLAIECYAENKLI
jgi:hypothetical protein